jgi:NAD(P)-dependent dehydrogenase (short-subunit alcohol dehydrogenase family)
MPSPRLSGKVTLVTGAGRGIGLAIAEVFAEEGATVIATDIALSSVDDEIAGAVHWHQLDVTDADAWASIGERIGSEHGKLDVLVNNAGIVHAYDPIDEIELEAWQDVIAVNQTGTFLGMRTAIPLMRRAGGGSIINMSSMWGIVGAGGVAAYQASKGAVRAMTKNAAVTYGHEKIRANSIHPGVIDTPLVRGQDDALTQDLIDDVPLGRIGTPREIAHGALFLASDESSYVTGLELVIDGGYIVK